jgi:hypothetical protein
MKVYIVETGDYEEGYVFGIYSSRELAIKGIKASYGSPYIVRWTEDGDYYLIGHFDRVPGYSTEHRDVFSIEEYEVDNGL